MEAKKNKHRQTIMVIHIMTTQAIISIVKNGHTIVKIISGCGGYNAEKLAEIIKSDQPDKIQDIYDIALKNRFGCKDCLVVMNKNETVYKGDGHVGPLYHKTFDDPSFNPRWTYGTAEYVIILKVDNSGEITRLEDGILHDPLYKIHDELTDKKLLGMITKEEERLLEDIRNDIEFRNGDMRLAEFYQHKIDIYKELLEQIKDLKKIIK